MTPHPRRSAWPAMALLPTLALLPGCGGTSRTQAFPADSAPAATVGQAMVRVTAITRAADAVTLNLAIANPTDAPIVFARHYGACTAATLMHGDTRIIGERSPKRSRTTPPDRYTILAGEEACLALSFRAPGIDSASELAVQLTGSARGVEQVWSIPIPSEPSRPTAMIGHH